MSGKSSYCVQGQYVLGTDPSSCDGTMMSLQACEPRAQSACANGEVSILVKGEPKCIPCLAGVEDYSTGTCKATCITKPNTTVMVSSGANLGDDKAAAIASCKQSCGCAYVIQDEDTNLFYPIQQTQLSAKRDKDCSANCTPVYVPNEEDPAAWAYQKIDHGYPSNSLTKDECQQYANSLGNDVDMSVIEGFNNRGYISASFNYPSGCTSRMFGKITQVYYNTQKFEKEATWKTKRGRIRKADLSGRKKKCGYVYGSDTNLQPYLCIEKRTPPAGKKVVTGTIYSKDCD